MTTDWYIYNPGKKENDKSFIEKLPSAPHWRQFTGGPLIERKPKADAQAKRRFLYGEQFQVDEKVIETVNAALYLRRPLLVTGDPGIGKSTLAYSIALDLELGTVLRWPITSHSTLKDGLYSYDAIGRLQEANLRKKEDDPPPEIGQFIKLGPLGTALLPTERPRVLLIDEIDKSDVDLPNNLLNVFEEGEFEIPELTRIRGEDPIKIQPYDANPDNPDDLISVQRGRIQCHAFPIIVLTSNDERDLPPAFLRRCLRLEMEKPDKSQLERIIVAHFGEVENSEIQKIVDTFIERRSKSTLATDQLLNAIFLVKSLDKLDEAMLDTIFKSLTS